MFKSQTNAVTEEKPSKSSATRQRLLDIALTLFSKKGFEETTMRMIASEAGLSLGSTYYYFETKEALIFEFYIQSCDAFQQIAPDVISESRDLHTRIKNLMRRRFEQLTPMREIYPALARSALDPKSPTSPFSPQTKKLRTDAISVFRLMLEESKPSIPEKLCPAIAKLLWLYHLGMILYWIYDQSPNQKSSADMLDRTLTLICRLLKLLKLPPIRSLVHPVLDLIKEEV